MPVSNKKWVLIFGLSTLVILLGLGGITAVIDPYFHYHKPLNTFAYLINNQRYQNNGIVKHFEYDAIITGSSMTENFKTSEFDALFGTHSVKIPYPGASYKEINDNLQIAVKHNDNIKIILRGLDYNSILDSADAMQYEDYPIYLYDDYLFNDVNYVFNKSILCVTLKVLRYTSIGGKTTDFDTYSNWNDQFAFGKEAVDKVYTRPVKTEKLTGILEEDYQNITENINQNVIFLVEEHPEIEFYLFFPPYSIYYWDSLHQDGILEQQLDAEKYIIELLIPHENIHLFSFFTEYDMICDLNNYKDAGHYSEDINSQILHWIQAGMHELTWENYEEYCTQMRQFYLNYDYNSLFEEE